MIETLEDIVEQLANLLGIYGGCPLEEDERKDCKCRVCFTSKLAGRIRRAVEVEKETS